MAESEKFVDHPGLLPLKVGSSGEPKLSYTPGKHDRVRNFEQGAELVVCAGPGCPFPSHGANCVHVRCGNRKEVGDRYMIMM
jgi:hypothetical protein